MDKQKEDKKEGVKECLTRSPGPAQYSLPPLVGVKGHDPTRWRGPAYTMAPGSKAPSYKFAPGPEYNIDGYNRFGKLFAPKWTLGHKRELPDKMRVPGPGTYNDQSMFPKKRIVAWTMLGKAKDLKHDDVPGPIYTLPGNSFGKGDVTARQAPVAYLFGRPRDTKTSQTPGPNHYGVHDLNKTKRRAPAAEMGRILDPQDRFPKPGPGTYVPLYNHYRRAPQYTFGIKHTPCRALFLTKQDNEFC